MSIPNNASDEALSAKGPVAGIYLHVPFCRQACHYCNFHFSTSLRQKDALLDALCREIEYQREYLSGAPLASIYLGGGTPSLLSAGELKRLFDALLEHHTLLPGAEVTLEANPDDLTPEWLSALRGETLVNRLSIGIQSLRETDLRLMNRAHDRQQALHCVSNARRAGFDNLTADLMYGLPGMTDREWLDELSWLVAEGVPHWSCYALTVEPRTALHAQVQKGLTVAPDETQTARQFELLMDFAAASGFEHYEISNFCRPGHRAVHNGNYWRGVPYLGIGPSAHSFDGHSRQWNIANNATYIRSLLQDGKIPFEREELTERERFNELMLTGLRTSWGVTDAQIAAFPEQYRQHFARGTDTWLRQGLMAEANGTYTLTRSGKLLADRIAMELFF